MEEWKERRDVGRRKEAKKVEKVKRGGDLLIHGLLLSKGKSTRRWVEGHAEENIGGRWPWNRGVRA